MRNIVYLLCLFLLGCSSSIKQVVRVGVDSSWHPWNFGLQIASVNGFIDDFLQLIAEKEGIQIEKITANSDFLFDGMKRGQYDVILSSMPAYSFNLAQYDFSENFLDLGLVLIAPIDSKMMPEQLDGVLLGVVDGSMSILQKMPDVNLRQYASAARLLDAVKNKEVEGAFLDLITAADYVNDLYKGELKIISKPLTDRGLHFLAMKGMHEKVMKILNQGVISLKEKEKLKELQSKWNLD